MAFGFQLIPLGFTFYFELSKTYQLLSFLLAFHSYYKKRLALWAKIAFQPYIIIFFLFFSVGNHWSSRRHPTLQQWKHNRWNNNFTFGGKNYSISNYFSWKWKGKSSTNHGYLKILYINSPAGYRNIRYDHMPDFVNVSCES